ncbi:MAG: hypothetical protein ACRD2G_11030 [Terriglobia bacterium]
MRLGKNDRELLLRYLLGELKPDEMARLDERLLTDGEMLNSMEETLNDLLDAYAAGELRPEQRERVEKALLRSSSQWERLRFARALRAAKPSDGAKAAAAAAAAKPRLWSTKLRVAVAFACAVLIAIGAAYWIRSVRHESTVNTQNFSSSKRPAGTAGQIPLTSQGSRAPQAQSRPQLAEAPPSVGHPHEAPFVLLLGTEVLRGSNAVRTVTLPRGLGALEVEILLDSREPAQRYAVEIESPQGAVIKSVEGLAPQRVLAQNLLRFPVGVESFSRGVYQFKIYRQSPAGPTLEASHRIEVIRPTR